VVGRLEADRSLDALADAAQSERTVNYDKIDRAKTVFQWGPQPKPGKARESSSKSTKAPAGGVS
jgi:hypothetical protein